MDRRTKNISYVISAFIGIFLGLLAARAAHAPYKILFAFSYVAPSFFVITFSLLILDRFPKLWKNGTWRIGCVCLFALFYAIAWCLVMQTHLYPSYYHFHTPVDYLIGSFLYAIAGGSPLFSYGHIIFPYYFAFPTAYVATIGVKNPYKRVLVILALTALIVWPSGVFAPS